jgi:hypothetical protein
VPCENKEGPGECEGEEEVEEVVKEVEEVEKRKIRQPFWMLSLMLEC